MKSDNRQMMSIPDDLLYRLEHLHGWHKGHYSAKICEIVEAALNLSDALKSDVPIPELQAAQISFIACCSPKLGFFHQAQTLKVTGEEADFDVDIAADFGEVFA